jgi:hypothetical protein
LPAVLKSLKEVGYPIEYEDHSSHLEDMRKHGAPPKMKKFVPTPKDMKTTA